MVWWELMRVMRVAMKMKYVGNNRGGHDQCVSSLIKLVFFTVE